MAAFLPPEYFVYALQAYFDGWYILIDLFFYILFFGGISKVALKDKFGKLLPMAFAFAFAFSLILVEAGTGFNLFSWSWIAILVATAALWFWLANFFLRAFKIPEKEVPEKQKLTKWLIIVITGFIALSMGLSVFAAAGEMVLQGRAASLGLGWNATPVANSIGMVWGALKLLLGALAACLIFAVANIASGHGPLALPHASAAQTSAATSDALNKILETLQGFQADTNSNFTTIKAKLGEIDNNTRGLSGLIEQISDQLKNYVKEFFKPVLDATRDIITKVSETNTIADSQRTALNNMAGEVKKVSDWFSASGKTLVEGVTQLQLKIASLPSDIAVLVPKNDELHKEFSELEKQLGEQEKLHSKLIEAAIKLAKTEALFEASRDLTPLREALAELKDSLDAAKTGKDELKTILESLAAIENDIKNAVKPAASIDLEGARKIVAEEIAKVTAAIIGLGEDLAKCAAAKTPKIVTVIGGSYLSTEKGNNVQLTVNSASQALEGLDEKAKLVSDLLKNAGVEKEIVELIKKAIETTAQTKEELSKAEIASVEAEAIISFERGKAKEKEKDTAEVIGDLEQLRKNLTAEISSIQSILSINSLIIEPVCKEFEAKTKNKSSEAKNKALRELSYEIGGVLQSVLASAIHSVKTSLVQLARLNHAISKLISETESSRSEKFRSIQSHSSSLVSSEEKVLDYLDEISETIVPIIVTMLQNKITSGETNISARDLSREIQKIINSKTSIVNTAKFIEYLNQVVSLFSSDERNLASYTESPTSSNI